MKKNDRVRTPAAPSSDGRVARPARPHAPWPRVKLGEVCEICPGTRVRRKDSQGGEYPVYGGGGATFTWPDYNREDQLIVSRFAMSEECVRFVKGRFFLNDSGLSVASSDKRLSQAYLDWCLYGKQPEIYALGRGAAQKNLDMEQFPLLEISLPPLPVQREIVARLERELGAVDKLAKKFEELETAAEAEFKAELKETFERFEGFEGLGEDEMVGRSVPDRRNRMTTKNALCDACGGEGTRRPTAVRWVKLGEVCEFENGDRGSNYPAKNKLLPKGEIPFISAINIANRTVCKDKLLYLSQKQYESLRAGKLKKGDVALCIRGSLGKFCIYPYDRGAIASSLVILRCTPNIETGFVANYLESDLFFKEVAGHGTGTAQPNLSAKNVMGFQLPLPPLAVQREIVAWLDAAKAKKDALVAAAKRGRETATLWRKAILKEAFA